MNKIFSLLAATFFAANLSCSQKSDSPSLGRFVSAKKIKKAQDSSIQRLDPNSISTGQKVHKVDTQEVISSQRPVKLLSKEWVTEVTEAQAQPGVYSVTTLKKVSDPNWEQGFVYEFKNVYEFPQVDTLSALDQLNTKKYHPAQVMETQKELLQSQDGVEIAGVAYANLVKQQVQMTPPEKVIQSPQCKGLRDCAINADLVTYDIIFLLEDGSTKTYKVEWYFSSEVPFFAAVLKQCTATVVQVENLGVLVKQCTEVVDFDR